MQEKIQWHDVDRWDWNSDRDIGCLEGLTIIAIKQEPEELRLATECGRQFKFFHEQNCCESVYIESIVGDLDDLIGAPLLKAEEVTSSELTDEQKAVRDAKKASGEYWYEEESFTWTFYKFATRKGYVDIRWYGSSNGCYSEGVSLRETTPKNIQ